ncbi:hypothetical protein [Silvanigrella sp.]|uniref:hypothetical protein n=1 Tax=Silvanigrella sp. TaxID=2024976 RepID=UPI0037C61ED8
MGGFIKYIAIFMFFGVIWFGILSIQVSKKTSLFVAIQKELKIYPEEEEDQSNKKSIDREKVIDAISKAFSN